MKRPGPLLTHPDTLAGAVLLGFCAASWWLTTGFDEVPVLLSQNVPPTFFPRLVIAVAALLGASLMIGGIRRRADAAPRPPAAHEAAPETASAADAGQPHWGALLPPAFWATVGVIAAAGVCIPMIGSLVTLGLVAVVLPLTWGERRYRSIAVLAVGLPAGIYAVFILGLGVRFPTGYIWTLLAPG